MSTPVALSAFGSLRAFVDGVPADLGGPRQRSVLARLVAAGGHVISTDRIIDDLWVGEPPPKALAALQVHVSNLRRALEPDRPRRAPASVLVSAAPGYALALPVEAVDVWRLEARLARAEHVTDPHEHRRLLSEALDGADGDPFAEFADAGWAAPEIARLAELRLVAREQRAGDDLALGRAARLVPELERHLHDHPLREEAVRLLALALYRAGRQGDALAALRAARDRLADQLGVDPGPALRALEAAVLAQAPTLDAPTPSPQRRSPGATRPRVASTPLRSAGGAAGGGAAGRLVRAGEAARGGARIVWVAGEAGAGKTTLAEAAAQELAGEGWTVVWGRCPEVDGAPPAWAWTEVVQNLGGELPQAASAFWLARSAAQRLATAPGPLVVVFDDVHRADAATLQILRQVVAELAHHPVLVVLTYRASEAGEDLAVTSAVLAAATIDRMDVEGLDRGQVARLARESGLDLDDGQVAELTERTGGNPLFVREFVRLLAAEGPAAARHGVPAGVRDVLRRRLARLTGTARTVLRQAAVLGRESDVDVLAQVWGGDPDDLLDALEAAVLAGLLSEPAPNRVRFTHALVRDTLYADLPLLRRTRAHAAALAVLARRTPDDAAQLAHHALAAATPDTAATAMEYAVAAARQAAAMFAHVDAARLWAAAVAAHELSGRDDDARLVELLVPLVGAQASAGATSAARLTRDRAVELALRLGRRDLLIAALASWRTPVSWSIRYSMRTDDDDLVERTLRSVLAGPVPDDATRALLLVAEVFEAEDHDVPAAIEASGRALEAARRSGDTLALCAALNARCYVSLGPDLVDERDPTASELLDVATAAGLLGYQALAHFMLFLGALARTDLAGAQRHLDLALERSTTGQLGQILGVLAVFEATREVAAGHLDAAEHLYAAFSRRLEDQDAANGSEIGLIGRFVVGFARGDVSPLVDPLRALYDVVPGAMPEGLVLALLDAGRPDEARSVWDPSLAIARNYYWLGRTALRARAAARLSDTAEAAVLYGQLLPWAGRVAGLDSGSVTFGTVDASLAVLADALGWPAEADAHRAADARLRAAVRRQLAGLIRTSGVRDGGTTGSGRGA